MGTTMKFLVLAALFSCALGGRMVIPRLPLSQLLRGDVHLIDEDRIVGGTVVEPNSLPFKISLQRRSALGYSQSCGGSIYSESVILNAAHCVRGATVSNFRAWPASTACPRQAVTSRTVVSPDTSCTLNTAPAPLRTMSLLSSWTRPWT